METIKYKSKNLFGFNNRKNLYKVNQELKIRLKYIVWKTMLIFVKNKHFRTQRWLIIIL